MEEYVVATWWGGGRWGSRLGYWVVMGVLLLTEYSFILTEFYIRWGKSRFIVVHIESNTIINK